MKITLTEIFAEARKYKITNLTDLIEDYKDCGFSIINDL